MTIPSSRSLIFEVKSTGSELAFIRVLRLGLDNFAFGRLRTSSDFFGRLRNSPGIFGNDRVVFKKSQHSQDKNLTLTSQKKLAGILKGLTEGLPAPPPTIQWYAAIILSYSACRKQLQTPQL